jgi:hypothetical protein
MVVGLVRGVSARRRELGKKEKLFVLQTTVQDRSAEDEGDSEFRVPSSAPRSGFAMSRRASTFATRLRRAELRTWNLEL